MGYEKRLEQLIEAAKDGRVVGHGVQAEIIEDPNGLHYGDKQTFSFTIVKKNAEYKPKEVELKLGDSISAALSKELASDRRINSRHI
jgi:hypothetical protein